MKYILIAVLIVGLVSCSKKGNQITTVDCSGPPKSYATDVKPVLQSTCNDDSGCHGTGSSNGPGPLINYAQVFSARLSVRSAILSRVMPLNGSLSASQRNAILCWIDNGAPDN